MSREKVISLLRIASTLLSCRPECRLVCPLMAFCLVMFSFDTWADEQNWFDRAEDQLAAIYDKGNPELYLPFHTHHLRFAYSREKVDSFQENPVGLGIGRGIYSSDGDWRGIYAMGFQDSHFKPSWMVGYGYKTFWHPSDEWKVGVGYTAFLMARTDMGHYTPFPGILPLASVSYKNLGIETAYLPGGKGNGNILFFYGKYEIKP